MLSRDKLKTLYLYYINVIGHQTYWGNDMLQGGPTHHF